MIPVDKNIPVPASKGNSSRGPKYPWRQMGIGDSFLIPVEDSKKRENTRKSVFTCAYRQKPLKFTTRIVDGGIRVWRIA